MGPQVKGIAMRSALRALEQLRGSPVVESTVMAMPKELSSAIRYGTLIAASWYPMEWYRDFFSAVVATTGDSERLVREIGRESARLDMMGIYKTAFKLLSPQALFGLSTRLFSNYYDTGAVSIVESRKGYARAKWTNCSGFNRNLWVEIFGSSEMFLELAGATHVRTRLLAGGQNTDDYADLQAHWA